MVASGTDLGFVKIARPGISAASRTAGRAAVNSAAFRRALVLGTRETSSHRGEWFKNRRKHGRPGPARLPAGPNRAGPADGFEWYGKREMKQERILQAVFEEWVREGPGFSRGGHGLWNSGL